MDQQNIAYSILELAIVSQGQSIEQTLHNSMALAKAAEECHYKRIWFAEHHNSDNIGSNAPSLLIGYIAENTTSIRVGSGGIMLPNHSPLTVAEQFGTLESLFPGRIDLGLGRAPGSDQATARALRTSPAARQSKRLLMPVYRSSTLPPSPAGHWSTRGSSSRATWTVSTKT